MTDKPNSNKFFLTALCSKVTTEIKVATEDAFDTLRDRYRSIKDSGKKLLVVLQGVILILLGIYALLPVYAPIVAVLTGAIIGFFSTFDTEGEVFVKPITVKSILGIICGLVIGMIIGQMFLIGLGVTVGLTKAIIEGTIDVLDMEKATKVNNNSVISIITNRLKIGLLTGIVPIVGPLIAIDKLNKMREETVHLPRGSVVTKNVKTNANTSNKKTPKKNIATNKSKK